MIAQSADIRFECGKCGQRLVVEAAAAGLTADCPICSTGVTVPAVERRSRRELAKATEPGVPFADPDPETLRDELIDASLLNGKLVGDLGRAREETAQLKQELKELGEAHERLNATATHAQRELKTFQTERPQLKSEAAALRQRIAAADEALATQNAEAEATRATLESSRLELSGALAALDLARAEIVAERHGREAVQARLAEAEAGRVATERDLDGALGRLGTAETALGAAREGITRLEHERSELQTRLEDAGNRLTAAAELATKLDETATQLRGEREKLQTAESGNRSLTERCEHLRGEVDALRNDLKETHSGREVVEIRDRLAETTIERDRLTHRLAAVEDDLRKVNASEETLRTERDEALRVRDEAKEAVVAMRESHTVKDNDVLRGIVGRLNADIVQRTAEVARLKRGQSGLKIVYWIFGIGLLAVVAFALKVIPAIVR